MEKNIYAFTLVELIVVITILAILGTIGSLSFMSYQASARDSARISNISLIERKFAYYLTVNSTYPLPDNALELTSSGQIIGYQGEIGERVLLELSQAGEIVDPLDGEPYTYFVNANASKSQILALMEKPESLNLTSGFSSQTYAAYINSENRFPKLFGYQLGILTDSSNIPIQKLISSGSLDIPSYNGNNYTAHFRDGDAITGTGKVLRNIIPNANCTRIRQMGGENNGVYMLNPLLAGEFEAYCEMGVDDGGWMLVARTHPSSTNSTHFGWLYSTGSLSNDTTAYSFGDKIKDIEFSQLLFATYETDKNITAAMRWDINYDFFKSGVLSPQNTITNQNARTGACVTVLNIPNFDENCIIKGQDNKPSLKHWGAFGNNSRYTFNKLSTSDSGFVYSDGFQTGNNSLDREIDGINNMRGEQGMLFVR